MNASVQPAPSLARRDRRIALGGMALVIAAAVLWGTTGTAQSLAPAGLPAYWVGALRLVVAAVAFVLVAWVGRRMSPRDEPAAALPWLPVIAAGACIAVYNLAFFAGIRASGVAVGTALTIGSGPIWAGLLQTLFAGKRPDAAWWGGTLLAVAGGCLMVLGPVSGVPATPLGIGLCLVSGLGYAAYTLINKRLVALAPASTVTLRVFAIAAAIALPLAYAGSGAVAPTLPGVWVLLYLGVVTTAVAYLLFSLGLKHVSGATGVTLVLVEPLVAFTLALLVVGERASPASFAGLALLIAGLAAVMWTELRRAPG